MLQQLVFFDNNNNQIRPVGGEPQRGLGEHSHGAPKHFHGARLGRNFFEFFFSKWYILLYFIFLADGRTSKRCGAWGSLPLLPHPLDGPELDVTRYTGTKWLTSLKTYAEEYNQKPTKLGTD